jgi:AhpD family alkylhydroperoxidase
MRMTTTNDLLPDSTKGIQNIYKAIYGSGADPELLELVHLRVSQINGCAACLDAGFANARKHDIATDKLDGLTVWCESPQFTPAEKVSLELSEEMTRLADRRNAVTDELWDRFAKELPDEKQRAGILLMVSLTNLFNRMNTTLQVPVGTRW